MTHDAHAGGGTGPAAALRAGDAVRALYRTAVGGATPPEEVEAPLAAAQRQWEEVRAADPGDLAAATGLAVVHWMRFQLRADDTGAGSGFGWEWDDPAALPEPGGGDTAVRSLGAAAAGAARRALALDPRDDLAAFLLGLTLEQTGDRPGAAAAYRSALDADPGDLEAGIRLAAVGGTAPAPAEECGHSQGMLLLRLTSLVSNNGDKAVWTWLLADPAAARGEADTLIAEREWDDLDDFRDTEGEESDADRWDPASPDFAPMPDDGLDGPSASRAGPTSSAATRRNGMTSHRTEG